MNKLLSIFIVLFLFSINSYAQKTSQDGGIKGTLISSETLESVKDAQITILKTIYSTKSLNDGSFKINNLEQGDYKLLISANSYEDYFMDFSVKKDLITDLGSIPLKPELETDITNEGIPTITAEELSAESGSNNVSGLLHGSRDVFLSAAAYTFGTMRFKIRGYKNVYSDTYINGLPMSNMENGSVYWSNWGGLNNVTRYKDTHLGLTKNNIDFNNVGGLTNIIIRPSKFRKQTAITYSLTNKNYHHRTMATISTGLMDNGWALSFSGSRRWSQEGYVDGTYYDTWAYFASIEKKFNNKHSISFTALGSPYRRGKQGASTQEAYDLVGNNFYNPYWGYQTDPDTGEKIKRNSREAKYHKPMAMLNHFWDINRTTSITTSVAYRFGRSGSSSLNWYKANDPRPDYYRYLPSYMTNEESYNEVAESFANNTDYNQIDWDYLYQVNRNSMETVPDGIAGDSLTGLRAQYLQEEKRYDQKYFVGGITLNKQIGEHIFLDFGANYRKFQTSNYKTIIDLLGADYWLDIDKYAEREIHNSDSIQSDLRNPNNIVREGDIYGYHYDINVEKEKTWLQTNFKFNRIEFFVAGFLTYTTFWRHGHMENGKFRGDESFGDSEKNTFLDYGGKTGFLLKLSGRHYIHGHAAYLTQAPTPRNSYISPRTRDHVVANLQSEKIMSADIGYSIRAPRIKGAINFYYTKFNDGIETKSFYHDGYRNFVNYVISGIDKTHQGIEFSTEVKITSSLSAVGVTSLGYYRWSSRPIVNVYVDNSSEQLADDKTVYVENYLVSGTPQTVATIGLNYRAPKYIYIGINANYFDHTYLSFNPERRTNEAVEGIIPATDEWSAIVAQERLSKAFTLDANLGKSFKFGKYFLLVNLNVNNILNNKEIITGGYEQLRYDLEEKNPNKFPSKYYYLYGTQYYLNISFRF